MLHNMACTQVGYCNNKGIDDNDDNDDNDSSSSNNKTIAGHGIQHGMYNMAWAWDETTRAHLHLSPAALSASSLDSLRCNARGGAAG